MNRSAFKDVPIGALIGPWKKVSNSTVNNVSYNHSAEHRMWPDGFAGLYPDQIVDWVEDEETIP